MSDETTKRVICTLKKDWRNYPYEVGEKVIINDNPKGLIFYYGDTGTIVKRNDENGRRRYKVYFEKYKQELNVWHTRLRPYD